MVKASKCDLPLCCVALQCHPSDNADHLFRRLAGNVLARNNNVGE